MATYNFNPNGALDTASELAFVNSQLEQSLSTLTQKVNAFIAANEGQAPANYTLAQQQWNKGQVDMNAALALASSASRRSTTSTSSETTAGRTSSASSSEAPAQLRPHSRGRCVDGRPRRRRRPAVRSAPCGPRGSPPPADRTGPASPARPFSPAPG